MQSSKMSTLVENAYNLRATASIETWDEKIESMSSKMTGKKERAKKIKFHETDGKLVKTVDIIAAFFFLLPCL